MSARSSAVLNEHTLHKEIRKPAIKAGERMFRFRISDGSPDRMHDVIPPSAWRLDAYRSNPVVLWAHDYHQPPIARTIQISVIDGALKATAEFPPDGALGMGR